MDISSLGGVANTYSYANQIRKKQVTSSEFAKSFPFLKIPELLVLKILIKIVLQVYLP